MRATRYPLAAAEPVTREVRPYHHQLKRDAMEREGVRGGWSPFMEFVPALSRRSVPTVNELSPSPTGTLAVIVLIRTAVEPEVKGGENVMEERKEGAVPFVTKPQPPSPLLGHYRRKSRLLELAGTAWSCFHSSWFCSSCAATLRDAGNDVMAVGTTA
ncbi:uncharacterized protein LOC110279873 [Arachis duranensis]|uniref:Uncharacterized protein LOC110279873 n=1 Tax=Arachis duranensis TaxID=130453 RepID=A0A9C6TNE5_ARADU|nr:uncharacterized protein LOC110279873 [Arachis duranensis]